LINQKGRVGRTGELQDTLIPINLEIYQRKDGMMWSSRFLVLLY
jgi:hypothetical protein